MRIASGAALVAALTLICVLLAPAWGQEDFAPPEETPAEAAPQPEAEPVAPVAEEWRPGDRQAVKAELREHRVRLERLEAQPPVILKAGGKKVLVFQEGGRVVKIRPYRPEKPLGPPVPAGLRGTVDNIYSHRILVGTTRGRAERDLVSRWELGLGAQRAMRYAETLVRPLKADIARLDARVSELETPAIPWWGWLALALGAIGAALGLWRLVAFSYWRPVY